MDKLYKSALTGVRGRLLSAFLGISAFSVIAAVSGLYSLSQVGGAIDKITEQRVPEALAWLELSRRVETVVRAAPALLAVKTDRARRKVSKEIASQVEQLEPLLKRNRSYVPDEEGMAAKRVVELVADMTKNLLGLDALVKERLAIVARREKLVRQLARANSVAQRTLSPGARILDAQIADWNRSRETANGEQVTSDEIGLANSIIELIPQQKAAALVDAVHNNLLGVTDADTAEGVDVLLFPVSKSIKELADIAQRLPERAKKRLEKQIGVIERLVEGPNSLLQVRKDELAVIARAKNLLAVNVRLSGYLTNQVSFLVDGAHSEIYKANVQAAEIQTLNRNVLISVVVLSLVSSLLIVWLYVGRNLIGRLTALSDSMLAIAEGDLRAPLPPPRGRDEISLMANALVVFRDTAIEVEESNLREIEEARRRLIDAIENSSEGFAFYDPDDRLVICNTRYKELLCSNLDIRIEPGMQFETIIRAATGRGLLNDAGDRIGDWGAELLSNHRDPGKPRTQKRGGDQWVLITERRTGDGGIVSIFSDITELKRREEELSEKTEALEQKSNALEQLSNQLAKYLSPQVYNSIFSGKQEVKVASNRKKLTVFFSDIVGFTETADRMESEELTHLVNHYLTEMSRIALNYGATIDKYVGDAILIFFGDPESSGIREDALACVKMAISMQKRLDDLADVWRDSGIENPLQTRMGIHSGYCTVGNFGSEDRLDYTIIGGAVNTASRLEAAAKPGEILISYETFAHVKGEVLCEEHGEIDVKGISYPVATYRVIDTFENLGRERRHFREEHSNIKIDMDLEAMTKDDRRPAADILRRALALITDGDMPNAPKNLSEDPS